MWVRGYYRGKASCFSDFLSTIILFDDYKDKEKPANMNAEEYANELLEELYSQARAQFGSGVKSYWFYNGELCPGCGRKIDTMRIKGKKALSLNAFIYRERGVLIGYVLCSRCARRVFKISKQKPGKQTTLHTTIEKNLLKAYKNHMASMDA